MEYEEKKPEELKREATVDVIIPVYRPDDRFKKLLERLLKQTRLPKRIIVMNTEKRYWDEKEYRALFEASSVELLVSHLSKTAFDHGGTRNQGILLSDADICICMTQDAVPKSRTMIARLTKALEEEKAAVSYARQLPASDCGAIERITREFNYPKEGAVKTIADLDSMGIKAYFCSNVCAAYWREVYLKLGGFTGKTIFNEDMVFAALAMKAGYSVVYASDAEVIHSHNYTGMEQIHRNFDLAVSQADHPEVFSGLASEGEGIRLVKRTAASLMRMGRWYLLPELVYKSGCKYLGFRLGKMYQSLPRPLILKLTMNRSYWEQTKEEGL